MPSEDDSTKVRYFSSDSRRACSARLRCRSVLNVLKNHKVKGIAHITGGGLTENLPRILPAKPGLGFFIDRKSWQVHNIFQLIQSLGSVSDAEMFKTFNMGIGMVLVVGKSDSEKIMKKLKSLGETAYVIGSVGKGRGSVEYV